MTVDLAYERPPRLYPVLGRPPLDAWDLQIAAPPPLVAWLELRRQRGQQSGIYGVGAHRAIRTVAEALPALAMSSEWHFDELYHQHPHVHVLLAAQDPDGRPLERKQLEEVAAAAWTAHVDRMVDYARERPHLGLQWRADGSIAGVDHTSVPPFSCTEFDWLDQEPILPALP